jgi:hypothetical protein
MQSAGSERQSGWEPSDGSSNCRNDDRGGAGQFHAPTGVRISGVSRQTRRLNPLKSEQQCIATPYTVHEDFEPTFRAFWTHLGIVARRLLAHRPDGGADRASGQRGGSGADDDVEYPGAEGRIPNAEDRAEGPDTGNRPHWVCIPSLAYSQRLFALQGTQWTGRASPNGPATG